MRARAAGASASGAVAIATAAGRTDGAQAGARTRRHVHRVGLRLEDGGAAARLPQPLAVHLDIEHAVQDDHERFVGQVELERRRSVDVGDGESDEVGLLAGGDQGGEVSSHPTRLAGSTRG